MSKNHHSVVQKAVAAAVSEVLKGDTKGEIMIADILSGVCGYIGVVIAGTPPEDHRKLQAFVAEATVVATDVFTTAKAMGAEQRRRRQ